MKKNMRTLTKEFYRNNKTRLLVAILFSLIYNLGLLLVSPILKEITDIIAEQKGMDALIKTIVETVLLFLVLTLVGILLAPIKYKYVSTAMKQYKAKVFEKITDKGIGSFSGENTATYISSLTNDMVSVENNYINGLFSIITEAVTFLGSLAIMIIYSPLLTAATILFTVIPVITAMLTGNKLVKYERKVSDANETYVGVIQEALKGFSVIKCFKAEDEIGGLVNHSSELLEDSRYKKNVVRRYIGIIGTLSGGITQFGLFIFGAYLAIKGKGVTAGTLLMFVNLINGLLNPINAMMGLISDRRSAKNLIKKIAEKLSVNNCDGTLETSRYLNEDISFDHVSFGYDDTKDVLKDISISFEKGKSYALVGASGSGKSTILNLLMAGHKNYRGNIRYDNDEIKEISTESLYDKVSLIEQNVFVFNASIRDNITMFKEFEESEVERVIYLSGLDKLIKEKGKEYLCGENGSNLSGGEKQRISIARSLLRKSSILLVDEATAALDAETSSHVNSSILNLEGLTRIVVTHDLDEGSLTKYDEIVALKDGKIIEKGMFHKLMEQKGYFYSLYTVAQ